MGEVVEFPLAVVNGMRVRFELSTKPEPPANHNPGSTLTVTEDDALLPEDEEAFIELYSARLCEAKSPQVYLDILKEFLCQDEYEMVLLAIMDSEYFDDLDELGVTFVNGYFKLMGFEPDDPRAA